jgi:citrate lyase subunit beta/citryl-CoA lyase
VAAVRPPVVRVNGADTEWFADDLALVRELQPDAMVLPKATPEAVAALGPEGPPVVAIVETAAGLRAAYETACADRVAALLLGAVDLGAELGLEPRRDGLEILYARSQVVVDSSAAGIRPPFDIVHLDVHDETGLEEECRLARSLGLRGKACIHPAQLEVVHGVFAPTEAEREWARRVVDAYEREAGEGRGVFALNGAMVDLPVVERAQRILDEAERSGRR